MKVWAWTTAGVGLILIVLTYIQGALLGSWADEHATVSQTMPGSGLEFVVAALGVVLLVGGVIVGIRASRSASVR
ncbi:hypothetical protein AX769_17165 [Frondihabitans sp. PAMC 28766]|nr:hypothetical protein AX769_17165 [Frondihabitans sp. PAMC 28766]